MQRTRKNEIVQDVRAIEDGELVEIDEEGEVIEEEGDLVRQVEAHAKKPIKTTTVEVFSSGIDMLDLLAGGGHPWGRIINVIGDKSTGKTLIESELVAHCRKVFGKKLKWVYDDAEAGYSFDSKTLYGFDMIPPDQGCSETLEDFKANVERHVSKLKSDDYLIYVLDSFDSLTSEEEIKHHEKKMKALQKGKTLETGTYGTSKAKGMSEFFRIMRNRIAEKKCLLVIISQVRENIGISFGPKYYRTGGKALDFYSSQIFWLAEVEKKIKGDRATGITVKIRNTKNKIGKPFREGFIDILFDYGVDNLVSNLKFLYGLRTETGRDCEGINKKVLNWDGQEMNLRQLVRHIEKENLEDELRQRCSSYWAELEEKASGSAGRKPRF